MIMKLSELILALPDAHLSLPPHDPEIRSVASDSRQVRPGALFVAIRGETADGHAYISQAIAAGAAAVIGEQEIQGLDTYIRVRDSREALAWLSAAWHGYPARRLVVIGVTGTDGKTTTTNLVHSILQAAGIPAGMISTVNAVIGRRTYDTGLHTTTPDAPDVQRYLAEMVQAGLTHVVLETTSHGLAQHRVAACEYDVAVLTNITREHLDYHKTFEAYRAAKARLFEALSAATRKPGVPKISVLNADDPSFEDFSRIPADVHLSYSLKAPADITAQDVVYRAGGTLAFRAVTPVGVIPMETALLGAFNISNILAAVAVGVGLGLPVAAIQEGVRALRAIPGRMERIEAGQDFLAIVDFAHTPHALERALEAARRLAPGRIIAVFGAAGRRDTGKRPLMGAVAARLAERVILTAEDPRTESLDNILAALAAGCEGEGKVEGRDYWRIPDRGEAITFAVEIARPGDVVIVCGKGHEQSMAFGTTEYPWDDRVALRAALDHRLGRGPRPVSHLPTASE
jgi:UDP-N-acetylmuramoyl-L-alanyl-D-glutamate--2,6-diaminopimelate ligase